MDEIEHYHYEQARTWLEHVRGLKRSCDRSSAMVEVFERIADSVAGIDYTRERTSGSAAAKSVEDAIARLDEMRMQHAANVTAYGREAVDASNRIAQLENPNEAQALTMHYCDGQEWPDVAKLMGYSEARIYEIRRSGVLHAYDVMPTEWRDPRHQAL